MATHSISITTRATEPIRQYSLVQLVREENPTDGLPGIVNTSLSTDIILGIAITAGEIGDLVTVRLPFSGILPAYAYSNVTPGSGLVIGQLDPGSLSDNDLAIYKRKVAYVMQVAPSSGTSSDPVRCAVIFVRAHFN